MGSKSERLNANVPAEAKSHMRDVALSISTKKGNLSKAYRQLVELAYATPDAAVRTFSGDEELCTLDARMSEIPALTVYQRHHRFSDQTKAFKDALLRGLSIHLAAETPKT